MSQRKKVRSTARYSITVFLLRSAGTFPPYSPLKRLSDAVTLSRERKRRYSSSVPASVPSTVKALPRTASKRSRESRTTRKRLRLGRDTSLERSNSSHRSKNPMPSRPPGWWKRVTASWSHPRVTTARSARSNSSIRYSMREASLSRSERSAAVSGDATLGTAIPPSLHLSAGMNIPLFILKT